MRKLWNQSFILLAASALLAGTWAAPALAQEQDKEDPPPRGESAALLSTIVVWGEMSPPPEYAGGQVATGINLGILGNRSFMDTPFNTTGYTSKYIADIQAKTAQEVLATDPTVRFQYPAGSMVESMYIRGMTYNMNNASLNGMMGLAPSFSVATEMLERIEVLRGPSAFLNGLNIGSEPNGGLNMVLKHALPDSLTRLTVDYTSEGQVGTHLDFSRRFGAEKQFGLRFNGAVRGGDTEVDGQEAKRRLGSLALDYTTDRVKLNLDAYQVKNEFDGAGSFVVQAANMSAANISILKAPKYENSIKGLHGEQDSQGILFQSEVKFTDYLTGYAGIGYADTEASGFYGGGIIANPNADGIGTLSLSYSNVKLEKTAYQAGLRGQFNTGPVKHNLVLDYSRLDLTQYQLNGSVPGSTASIPGVSIYDPVFDTSRVPRVKPRAPKLQEQELTGISFADTLDFGDGLILLTAGVRHQSVNMDTYNQATGKVGSKYDQSKNSPMYSVVVKPLADRDRLAFYFSYIEGLQRGSIVGANFVNAGEVLAPYESKQYELGAKWNMGTFTNTLSFYQIDRPSYISRPVTGGLMMAQDGKQRNRGVEWMFFGEVLDSTRLLGGLSYTKTELLKTAGGTNQGNEVGGYPKWQGNIGVEWDTFFEPDLTLISRGNFNGKMYANNTNTKQIPGWATFDVGARYQVDIYQRPVTFRLNVDNVLDKQEFWAGARTGGVFYTMPGRTFKLSASIDF